MTTKRTLHTECNPLIILYVLWNILFVDATIDVFDSYGRKIDSFQDREVTFSDDYEFMPMEGYIVGAEPLDGCSPISPPSFLANFTFGKFVLINGTERCEYSKKVINAQEAGYDLVVLYDPFPMPFEYLSEKGTGPKVEINIQVVFISFMDGLAIKENYLFNNSYSHNYKVRIRPNTPDITYYMYLFVAVIGICFFVMLLFMMCLLVKCVQERRKNRRSRLSRSQIKQIPTAKYAKGDQYDVCAICLEDYNEGDKLRLLPCSHAYHAKCIDHWLTNNRRNCPLCKRKITFGDSDSDDSSDSELTSPAENTPLLTSPVHRAQSWGTFVINPALSSRNPDGSGPSSMPDSYQQVNQSFVPESEGSSAFSQALSTQESENILPPPQLSINRDISATSSNSVLVNHEDPNDSNGLRGLLV